MEVHRFLSVTVFRHGWRFPCSREGMIVQRVLNDEDPERLRRFGPLADEYAHEAQMIAEQVSALPSGQRTIERVTDIVTDVWLRMFGEVSGDVKVRRPVFERVAQRILNH
jgi:hypothetical protein